MESILVSLLFLAFLSFVSTQNEGKKKTFNYRIIVKGLIIVCKEKKKIMIRDKPLKEKEKSFFCLI